MAAIVHKGLNDALNAGIVVRNVADAAKKPRQPRSSSSTMQIWSRRDVGRFLQGTEEHRLHAMWVFFATTGTRRGEVLGLHWDDIDLQRGRASIRRTLVVVNRQAVEGTPKGGEGRQIALASETLRHLKSLRSQQMQERLTWGEAWTNNGLVFTQEDGAPIHPDRVTDEFRRLSGPRPPTHTPP